LPAGITRIKTANVEGFSRALSPISGRVNSFFNGGSPLVDDHSVDISLSRAVPQVAVNEVFPYGINLPHFLYERGMLWAGACQLAVVSVRV